MDGTVFEASVTNPSAVYIVILIALLQKRSIAPAISEKIKQKKKEKGKEKESKQPKYRK